MLVKIEHGGVVQDVSFEDGTAPEVAHAEIQTRFPGAVLVTEAAPEVPPLPVQVPVPLGQEFDHGSVPPAGDEPLPPEQDGVTHSEELVLPEGELTASEVGLVNEAPIAPAPANE